MNRNVLSIWETFEKAYTDLDCYEVAAKYVEDELNLDEHEVKSIACIAKDAVYNQFDEKTMKKMLSKSPELYATMVSLTITGIFFGVYLSRYLHK